MGAWGMRDERRGSVSGAETFIRKVFSPGDEGFKFKNCRKIEGKEEGR